MATEFVRPVQKGEPITAAGWNELQGRVAALESIIRAILRNRPGSLGACIVRTGEGGIDAAADADTPAFSDDCELRVFDGVVLADAGFQIRVYNFVTGADGGIAGDKQIAVMPLYGKPGFQFVCVDPCPS